MRILAFIISIIYVTTCVSANIIVVDDVSGDTLPGVTVFNSRGNVVCQSDVNGHIPYLSPSDFPLTLRCIGFKDATDIIASDSIVRMENIVFDLPEVVLKAKKPQVMHIIAYVRDYSHLSTYEDTVTMFREKWIDYMIPLPGERYDGWHNQRVLKSKSYYRFSDSQGLDSVSDRCNQHFTWSDWITLPRIEFLPKSLINTTDGEALIEGKYNTIEVWTRRNNDVTLSVDVLNDSLRSRWVSNFASFFHSNLDFEKFTVNYQYNNILADELNPFDIAAISCNIESRGRGHDMFQFNHRDEPFFVTTYTDMYIIDRHYLTVSEAKRWQKQAYYKEHVEEIEMPSSIPDVTDDIHQLITRVESIDHNAVRLAIEIDPRIGYRCEVPRTTVGKIWHFIKQHVVYNPILKK